MCGRFTLRSDANALAQHFGLDESALAAGFPPPRYNIAPTQAIPVVRLDAASGRRELVVQRWGLVPHWAKDKQPLPALFNARAETLGAKPAFREAFRARRCLIPADGFYEWKAVGKSKQPWYIHMPDGGLFAFAGLWEGDTCTIITRAPTPALAPLHDRMPAIPAPAAYAAWLDPARTRPEELLPLLESAPELELYPVSPLVNRAAADTPQCVERAAQ
jgi:putative SOS response-associated peptidase YedK